MSKTKEYRQNLADMFASVLLEDELEWKRDWQGNIPRNGHSGYIYKGINRFLLSLVAMDRGYRDSRWCTFKQVQNNGWKLHQAKGQGVNIEYWFPYDREDRRMLTWKEWDALRKTGEEFGERYILRSIYKTVFNADLIEGIPELPEPEKREIHADELVEKISGNMGVGIVNDGGDRAFYRVNDDTIHLPLPEYFSSNYGYASTALHELGHATGASHRLARNMTGLFGGDTYAYEELVAEISSCFTSVNLAIEQEENHLENHKAYVQSWAKAIKENPDALIHAIQDAERAAAYMEYQAELITKAEYEAITGASLETEESKVMREEGHQKVAETPAREIARFVPQSAVYHLERSGYLALKTYPEHCEYVFYDRYLQEITRGEIELTGDPEMLRREILKQQGRFVRDIKEVPEEEFEKLQEYIFREPLVRIVHTESEFLEEGQVIPFSVANSLFSSLDQKTREKYGEDEYCDKTDFEIEYVEYGRIRTYSGRYDLGNLDGTLIEHMEKHHTDYRTDEERQTFIALQGEEHQKEENAEHGYIIHDLTNYLGMHELLGETDRTAQSELEVLAEKGAPNDVFEYENFYTAKKEYVRLARMTINCEENWKMPKRPELSDYVTKTEKERMGAYRKQVKKESFLEAENHYEPHDSHTGSHEEKKRAEHLSPCLQTLIVRSAQAEKGSYTMDSDEIPYASFLLLKEECEREGLSDHIIFGKKGDVVCRDLSEIYQIPDVSAEKLHVTPENKKRMTPSI